MDKGTQDTILGLATKTREVALELRHKAYEICGDAPMEIMEVTKEENRPTVPSTLDVIMEILSETYKALNDLHGVVVNQIIPKIR